MRYQHGDVILTKVEKIPKGLIWKKVKKGFVMERGEGAHTHTLASDECEIAEKDGVLYMREVSPSMPLKVDHEEHRVEEFPSGTYRKEIENEYDAETDETRKTQD